ncbi:MAG: 1-deoxy-D-xylulose-5-phosphate synthase [Erysipelotrichaceae bacterium]|nr:1-deoxy-D-xylulose-5-phosphate synthase [Erysipelotrichaceae bacterium]
MKLSEIKSPSDLKKMNVNELNQLCSEIRSTLIETVSKTGGHLSSNLGVVELTVALHYVFDSPKDKIFFDVGHQCYTHKLLTGRYDSFSTLRQFGGISGFEKRCESVHDVWEAGHSSTSLSAAYAMAVARDLNHENYSVVPVIGDGAIASGMSFEALDQIGGSKHNLIIIFNDNNMSISKNVGAISNVLNKVRTAKPYTNSKKTLKALLQTSNFGESVLDSLTQLKENIKKSVIDTSIFGEFGIDYIGPFDGHDIKEMINVFRLAKTHEGPIVIHLLTKKGKGYPLCEEDKEGYWHGVGAFDPLTGASLNILPEEHLTWSQIFSETLTRMAKKDPRICAITPAMITGSKLEKFFALYPERAFDCGIAEEHAATFAAGLAISNKRPFLSIYSTFLQRAYDQINHDICRMDLPVVLGIDRAQLSGEDGDTHHGVFDVGILTPLPHMILAQPKDSIEAQNLLYTAFHQNHPFGIRYPKGSVVYEELEDFKEIPIGSWEILCDSDKPDAYIITYGPEVDRLYHKMHTNNLNIAIVNARFFKPLDTQCICKIAASKKPVFTYEIDMEKGGLSSSILEFCNDNDLKMHLTRYGIRDQYVTHGSVNALKKSLGIDINTVCNDIIAKVYNK